MDVESLQFEINTKGAQADLSALSRAFDAAGNAYTRFESKLTSGGAKSDAALQKTMATAEKAAKVAALLGQVKINGSGAAGILQFAQAIDALAKARTITDEKINNFRRFMVVAASIKPPAGVMQTTAFLNMIANVKAPSAAAVTRMNELFRSLASFKPPASSARLVELLGALAAVKAPSQAAVVRIGELLKVLAEAKSIPNVGRIAAEMNMISVAAGRAGAAVGTLPGRLRTLNTTRVAVGGLDEAHAKTTKLSDSIGFLSGRFDLLRQVGTVFTSVFSSLTLGEFVRQTYEAANNLISLQKAMLFLTGSVPQTSAAVGQFNAIAFNLGLNIQQVSEGFSKFGFSAKEAKYDLNDTMKVFTQVATSLRVVGASADAQKNAIYALQEMLAKGKIQAKEYTRQFGQYIPGAAQFLADALSQIEHRTITVSEAYARMRAGTIQSASTLKVLGNILDANVNKPLGVLIKSRPDYYLNNLNNAFTLFLQGVGNGGFTRGFNEGLGAMINAMVEGDDKSKHLTKSFSDLARTIGTNLGSAIRAGAGVLTYLFQHLDQVVTVAKLLIGVKLGAYFLDGAMAIRTQVTAMGAWLARQGEERTARIAAAQAARAQAAAINEVAAAKAREEGVAAARAPAAGAFRGSVPTTRTGFGLRGTAGGAAALVAEDASAAAASTEALSVAQLRAVAGAKGLAVAETEAATAEGVATGATGILGAALEGLMANPITAALAGIAALGVAMFAFGDHMTTVGGKSMKLKDVWTGAFKVIGHDVGATFKSLGDWIAKLFAGPGASFPSIGDIVTAVANTIGTVFEGLLGIFKTFGAVLNLAVIAPMRDLFTVFQAFATGGFSAGVGALFAPRTNTQAAAANVATVAAQGVQDTVSYGARSAAARDQQASQRAAQSDKDAAFQKELLAAQANLAPINARDARQKQADDLFVDDNAKPINGTAGIKQMIRSVSEEMGIDPSLMIATAARESHFDQTAKATTTSASGLYQYVDNSWLRAVKQYADQSNMDVLKHAAEYIQIGKNGKATIQNTTQENAEGIMGLRFNPEAEARIKALEFKDDIKALRAALGQDHPVGIGEAYSTTFLGRQGAIDFARRLDKTPDRIAALDYKQQADKNKSIFYSNGTPLSYAQVMQNFNTTGKGKLAFNDLDLDQQDRILDKYNNDKNTYEQALGKASPQAEAQAKFDELQRRYDDAKKLSDSASANGLKGFYDADAATKALDREKAALEQVLHPLKTFNDEQAETAKITQMKARGDEDGAAWLQKLNELTKAKNDLSAEDIGLQKSRFMAQQAENRQLQQTVALVEAQNQAQIKLMQARGDRQGAAVASDLVNSYKGMSLADAQKAAANDNTLGTRTQIAATNSQAESQVAAQRMLGEVQDMSAQANMTEAQRAQFTDYKSALEQITGLSNLSLDQLQSRATAAERAIAEKFASAKEALTNTDGFQKWADAVEPLAKKMEEIKSSFVESLSQGITDAMSGKKVNWKDLFHEQAEAMLKSNVDNFLAGIINFGKPKVQTPQEKASEKLMTAGDKLSAAGDALYAYANGVSPSSGAGASGAALPSSTTAADGTPLGFGQAFSQGYANSRAQGAGNSPNFLQGLLRFAGLQSLAPGGAAQGKGGPSSLMSQMSTALGVAPNAIVPNASNGSKVASFEIETAVVTVLDGTVNGQPATAGARAAGAGAAGFTPEQSNSVGQKVVDALGGKIDTSSLPPLLQSVIKASGSPSGAGLAGLFGLGRPNTVTSNGAGLTYTAGAPNLSGFTSAAQMAANNPLTTADGFGDISTPSFPTSLAASVPNISFDAANDNSLSSIGLDTSMANPGALTTPSLPSMSDLSSALPSFTSATGGSSNPIGSALSGAGGLLSSVAQSPLGSLALSFLTASHPKKKPKNLPVYGVIGQGSQVNTTGTSIAAHGNPFASLIDMGMNSVTGNFGAAGGTSLSGTLGSIGSNLGNSAGTFMNDFSSIGSGFGNAFSSLAGFFKEGGYSEAPVSRAMRTISVHDVPHFKEGTSNTSGEIPSILHPNEAVVPLSRGRSIPVEMSGAAPSSNVTMNTNIHVHTPDVGGFRQAQSSIQRQTNRQTKRAATRNLVAA